MKYLSIINNTYIAFPISLHEDKHGMVYLKLGAKRESQTLKAKQKLIPYIKSNVRTPLPKRKKVL